MNSAPLKPSARPPGSKDACCNLPTERLTPNGLRPVCSEEIRALSQPRDNCGQGGFSDQGQQQVIIQDSPPCPEEDVKP